MHFVSKPRWIHDSGKLTVRTNRRYNRNGEPTVYKTPFTKKRGNHIDAKNQD